jgi:hypothetical protein
MSFVISIPSSHAFVVAPLGEYDMSLVIFHLFISMLFCVFVFEHMYTTLLS